MKYETHLGLAGQTDSSQWIDGVDGIDKRGGVNWMQGGRRLTNLRSDRAKARAPPTPLHLLSAPTTMLQLSL
jgi:hypothetical protein